MDKQSLIDSFDTLDDVTNWWEANRPNCPTRPTKPIEPKNGTPEAYKEYATEMLGYSELLGEYKTLLADYNKALSEGDVVFQTFIWKNTGLNTEVPEQYRSKVWDMAYQLGHSYGYSEIQNYLLDLVDIFRD
jgi:hypothetical protein